MVHVTTGVSSCLDGFDELEAISMEADGHHNQCR